MISEFNGATFDSRKIKPGMLFVAVKGETTDGHLFIEQALANGAVGIIDGFDELSSFARDYRRSLSKNTIVIAVTGSAGKTTTKEFLRAFLSCAGKVHSTEGNFNNHLGLPITILNCPKSADFLVVEMGTNHPGEIAHLCSVAEPDIGVVTNIGTAHIEFFKTRENIAKEKFVLLQNAKRFGVAPDNIYLKETLEKRTAGKVIFASPNVDWLKVALKDVLPGEHNVANAALAFEVASQFGVKKEDALKVIKNFSLPGSRWRKIEKNGVLFIDDTYNANPDAMIAALNTLADVSGRTIAILGDMFELGEESLSLHKRVFSHALSLPLARVIAVGEHSSKAFKEIKSDGLYFQSVSELARALPTLLLRGDTVLLKASHSMHLGDVLK